MKRKAEISRATGETDIKIKLVLDSLDVSRIDSGVPFFDHMLASMARHGRFCLHLGCQGDNEVDDHHTVEDIGICLGEAFKSALGERNGIRRFGSAMVPMDDALVMAAVDISGRSYFKYTGKDLRGYISKYSEELTGEFFTSLSAHCGLNLHLNLMYGHNRHHIHEALFKAAALALYQAMSIDESLKGYVLSTKGTIV